MAGKSRVGAVETAKFLLRSGALVTELDEATFDFLMERDPDRVMDAEGAEPILEAALNKSQELVELLVDAGVSLRTHPCGGKALAVSIENHHWETAAFLFAGGAAENPRYSWGASIVSCICAGRRDLAMSLIRAGDPSLSTAQGSPRMFPLAAAAIYDDSELLAGMLKAGAEPNARDYEQRTSLMQSVSSFRTRAGPIRLLIEGGADANARAGNGNTVMRYALGSGRAEVVEILLRSGASELNVDRSGASAWSVLHHDMFCRDAWEREDKLALLTVRS